MRADWSKFSSSMRFLEFVRADWSKFSSSMRFLGFVRADWSKFFSCMYEIAELTGVGYVRAQFFKIIRFL